MDSENTWLYEQLDKLFDNSNDYKERALFLGLKGLIEDQVTRKEQVQGELDGTLWSPKEWEE